jgi:kynurenine formamidase
MRNRACFQTEWYIAGDSDVINVCLIYARSVMFIQSSSRVLAFVLVFTGLILAGCLADAEEPVTGPALADLFSGEMTIVDLSHALDETNPVWGAGAESPFSYRVLASHESGRAVMGAFSTADHYGTHIDAPTHGGDNLPTVDELDAHSLFGPLAVINISVASSENADYALTVADILAWESAHGALPARSIVIAYTGWSQKWDDHEAYLNRDADGDMHFPGFSEEAGLFLANERDILGIGIDNMSVDPAAANGFPAHGAVNGSGKFHLENVANAHLLPASGAWLIVAPVKVTGGSGGPVRLFAVLP